MDISSLPIMTKSFGTRKPLLARLRTCMQNFVRYLVDTWMASQFTSPQTRHGPSVRKYQCLWGSLLLDRMKYLLGSRAITIEHRAGPLSRNSPSATDMICDVDRWSGRLRGNQNLSISVVDQCKEHSSKELFGLRQFGGGEEINDIGNFFVLDVELRGNPFNAASVGAGKRGYHSPPLVSCLATGKGDEVSVKFIGPDLFCPRAVGQ